MRPRGAADASGRTGAGSRRGVASRRCAARSSAARRSAALRSPLERQRDHYLLDEDVTEPVEADWLLGAFLLMRRAMLDELGGWDEGYRHYVEDIDLCLPRDAGGLGALVRAGGTRDARLGAGDRPAVPVAAHALARAAGMARFVRKHPETLAAL